MRKQNDTENKLEINFPLPMAHRLKYYFNSCFNVSYMIYRITQKQVFLINFTNVFLDTNSFETQTFYNVMVKPLKKPPPIRFLLRF